MIDFNNDKIAMLMKLKNASDHDVQRQVKELKRQQSSIEAELLNKLKVKFKNIVGMRPKKAHEENEHQLIEAEATKNIYKRIMAPNIRINTTKRGVKQLFEEQQDFEKYLKHFKKPIVVVSDDLEIVTDVLKYDPNIDMGNLYMGGHGTFADGVSTKNRYKQKGQREGDIKAINRNNSLTPH